MWKWANKQISFISRMSGINGELIDSKGKKTRKYKALLIWGNNPKKKNSYQFNTGGSTSPEDAIRGLKAMLSFAEADEKAEILEQIKLLSNPTPELDPEDDYDEDDYDEDEEDDMSEVDKSISSLTNNYIQEIDTILGVSELDGKRKALLKWIKDPQQNVKVIIAFSGGKDSVAMVLRCIYEFKIPTSQIELWHHEVDGDGENLFDWKCTPSYCKAFADAMGVPILFSYSGGGILREMYRTNEFRQPMYFQNVAGGEYIRTEPRQLPKDKTTKRKFPAVANDLGTRWCSSVAKIEVMSKAINRLPRFKNQNFVVMTGERRAESKNRSKYHEIEKYKPKKKPTKSSRQALTWRCVIDMTDLEVWDMYRKYKIQPHPCYELGWGRCSCQLCIFGQKDTWASINQISPEKVQKIMDIEKELDHTLYNEFEKIPFNPPKYIKSGVNAGEEKFQKGEEAQNVFEAKVVRGKSFIPKDALARWGKEALGEFVSPIFVKEFKMPFGAKSKEQMGAN
jgi:3'-phosphoadenosine 5'-phosphosulfate sulfotransferase (PAPS reductase)/FAD synthetase